MALLEKPGEVVTREELRARLWPKGTFVNFDANVNTTVNKLRLLLGGVTGEPLCVETIPRQGYCFVARVESRNELVKAVAPPVAMMSPASISEKNRAEKVASLTVGEMVSARLTQFWSNGWAAAILLCGVLIGMGIVLMVHRPS
jgi:DNA-binding winged helix-turn-helix (wHTH) protein